MMKDIMKKSVKKLLGMAVAVCMVFGAGMTAEAATYGNADKIDYGTLKKGDIIGKDTIIIIPAGILPVKLQNYNTGEETPGLANTRAKLSMYQIFPAKRYEVVGMTAEESFLRLELKAYKTSGPAVSAGVMTDEERAEQERLDREAAWKISKDNPDNYLPKITLSDGTKLQSSVASHFKKNKDSSISEVLMNMPEQEVNAAFGVTGKAYIHINAYKSQCGPELQAGFHDFAALLGNGATVCDITEVEMEVREKGTYQLLDVIKKSDTPVNVIYALQGEALEKAKAGNDCAFICYADGEVFFLRDMDSEMTTVTVNTDRPSGIFALVCAPDGTW